MATYQWDPVSSAVIAGLAPIVNFLTSLSFLGEMTHIVKTPALVRIVESIAPYL